jgi:tRNA-2-methylthio-N6-dimethylallyladenosine synthase
MSGRFYLRTFGCQMNQHDAEKIANLLHHEGYRPVASAEQAELVLVNTCSVRSKAESKLYTELGVLGRLKRKRPDLILGVGGCVAQQEGGRLLKRFPQLDFVFGPQNLRHLPAMLASARERRSSLHVEYEADRLARFALPGVHPEYRSALANRALVTVMEGCDLFCSFCVVPTTRGREVSRSSTDILDEVRRLADRGVIELTLLGQTVNAYGRPRPGRAEGEIAFAELIRRVAAVPGIERIRFTSPHPLFMTDELIDCYADVPELCPHLHLPVQSGSSRVLTAMNRRYDRERYLQIARQLRRIRPGLAISTDVIVAFPGETRADFEDTLSLMREVGFIDSFSFKYSPRPGTPAMRRGLEPLDPTLAQERLVELQELQHQLTLRAHRACVGSTLDVLVEGRSHRGGAQQTGRCPGNRVVNFTSEARISPGVLVPIRITEAQPHCLLGVPARRSTAAQLHLA